VLFRYTIRATIRGWFTNVAQEATNVAHPRIDARIAAVAGRQHGLITSAQLQAAGLDRFGASKRVRTGRLHPLYRGVYAVGHSRLSQEGRWMAAVLAAGEGAVLSHLAAAVHWRIWRRRWDGIDVLVPGNRRTREGFRVHRARHLDRRDTTIYQGIPITTPARTLVDLADTLTAPQLANVIHEAAFRNRFDEARTHAAMQRAQGRPLSNLHAALQAHAHGSAGTRSELEDRFLETWTGAEPKVNTKVHGIEVGMYWPEERLVVEIDGPGHQRPRTRASDEQRDRQLQDNGIRVLRIPSGDA
jgi:predicted transcriptional regulator of viral defense system